MRDKNKNSARRFCFTINNPKNSAEDLLSALQAHKDFSYCIFSLEKGDKRGTEHFQGYIQLKKPNRYSSFHSLLSKDLRSAHFEQAHGSLEDNQLYCGPDAPIDRGPNAGQTKGSAGLHLAGPYEAGNIEKSGQGARNDIRGFTDEIVAGRAIASIAIDNPSTYVRFHRGLHAFAGHVPVVSRAPHFAIALVGPPGTGKSKFARELFLRLGGLPGFIERQGEPYTWAKRNGNNVWLEGYGNQQFVLLDDFYGWIPASTFLAAFDQYNTQLEFKGGAITFNSTCSVFTSNKFPSDWYRGEAVDPLAVCRRVHVEVDFSTRRIGSGPPDFTVRPSVGVREDVPVELRNSERFSSILEALLFLDCDIPPEFVELVREPLSPVQASPLQRQASGSNSVEDWLRGVLSNSQEAEDLPVIPEEDFLEDHSPQY